MCGIVGYVGTERDAIDVLLDGLSGLEYRGYDSAGVALASDPLDVYKREGELSALESAVPAEDLRGAPCGIGHTRWSTHGPPSDRNAHPHADGSDRVAVVHNGIVENYQSIRDELSADGVTFASETDTEVVPHLIARALEEGRSPEAAFRAAIDRIEGSYAIAAVFAESDAIFATRQASPLVLGIGDDGYHLASDAPAFVEHTDRVCYLEDGQFARLEPDGMAVTDANGTLVETTVETLEWDAEDAGKSGYDHYMHKEIHEQPTALRQCLRGRVDELNGTITLEELDAIGSVSDVQLLACGTSYHAAVFGASLLCDRGVRATAMLASEYSSERVPVDSATLVVGVTQSGETADTMRALREANRAGGETVAVTNTVGSSAARECDHALYVRAGPEIGVAATKTFASQQVALTLLACHLGGEATHELVRALRDVPDQVQTILDTSRSRSLARTYLDSEAFFFIGRGSQYPVALEGALKLKEISYEHAEGFAAGELKHGPLALVTEDTPVFALVTGDDERARKTVSNVTEVKARGAPVVAVTDGQTDVDRYADHVLEVPPSTEIGTAITANVQLQLVAYWIAHELGRSIDKPRHLAKSVTVE